ncbi:hypothetical protein, partial [Gemella morbillorum]
FRQEFICKKQILDFDSARVEKKINDFIPDIILYKNNVPLIVEIAVTHFIDDIKYQKIKESHISCLEIRLSLSDLEHHKFDKKYINNLLINSISNKCWIFNEKFEQRKKEIDNKNKEKHQYLKNKIRIINNYLDNKVYQRNINLYENQLIKSTWFNEFMKQHRFTLFDIPPYLNVEIVPNIIFGCDNRLWQSFIFAKFIIGKKGKIINSNKIVAWIKRNKDNKCLNINEACINIKDVSKFIDKQIKNLSEVIEEYLSALEDYNFIRSFEDPSTPSNKKIKYELLKDYVDLSENGYETKETLEMYRAFEERERVTKERLTPYHFCKICGKYTYDYVSYDFTTDRCICRKCFNVFLKQ